MTIDDVLTLASVLAPWRPRGGHLPVAWRVIGPFSGVTLREMLAAIRRKAEA